MASSGSSEARERSQISDWPLSRPWQSEIDDELGGAAVQEVSDDVLHHFRGDELLRVAIRQDPHVVEFLPLLEPETEIVRCARRCAQRSKPPMQTATRDIISPKRFARG
jgi:hypothetical protein